MRFSFARGLFRFRLAILGAIAFLLVAILVLAAVSWSILQRQGTSPAARRFVAVIPVPAARVEGETLLYRDLLPHWDAVETMMAERSDPPEVAAPIRRQARAEAYDQPIRQAYLRNQAERERVQLPETAVESNLQGLLALQVPGTSSTEPIAPADADRFLRETVGWSLEEFRDRIVRPATLEEALARRAEAGGIARADWARQLEEALHGSAVRRFLRF